MADVGASDAVKIVRGLRCNEKKIEEVVDRVISILSLLRRARECLNHPKSYLFSENVVSYMAYKIEDVLETFVVAAAVMLQKNEARFIKRFPALNDGFVLRNIKANFLKVDDEIHFFLSHFRFLDENNIHDEPWITSQDQRWLRQTYPRGIDEHFVGMDDELEELVALVVEKKNQVISIWGVAGLGKTTIASKIYKHPDVSSWCFHAFAWVYFSQGCPISILLLSILRQLCPRQVNETTNEETLKDKLKEVLSWKPCLIVLDNIQDMDQWRQLSPALEMEGGKSVTLLTTHEENIANNVGYPHKLRLLNEDEAWDLLKKHAFPGRNGPDREQTHKLEFGDLLELETLFGFNSLIHDLRDLSRLNKLRHLVAHAYSNDSLKSFLRFITSHGARIRTKLFIENKCDFTLKEGVSVLEEVLMCPNLHALTLSMVLIYKVPDCGTRVSSDLTELKLIGCKIKEDPMAVLGKFPNLQKLCLGHGAFVETEMSVQANGFTNLAYLEIRSLPYFEEWRLDEGAMRNLSDLIIRRCPSLKMIPDGLESISNLKNLEIELAPEAFVDVSEEEYRQKFHFVPTRNIRRVQLCSTS